MEIADSDSVQLLHTSKTDGIGDS